MVDEESEFEARTTDELRALDELGLNNDCMINTSVNEVLSKLLLEIVSLRREITSLKMDR